MKRVPSFQEVINISHNDHFRLEEGMRLYPRPKTIIICVLLMAGMIRAAFWQWDRHLQKQIYVSMMDERLKTEPVDLASIVPTQSQDETAWENLLRRRVKISGKFDFEHEVILRNRRYDETAGVYVLTPLAVDGTQYHILVNRGFLPLSVSNREARKQFQTNPQVQFIGLIKESTKRRWFISPKDPEVGPGLPWADVWIRTNVQKIAEQLPYPLLPVHFEIMDEQNSKSPMDQIVRSTAGREELLVMGMKKQDIAKPDFNPELKYPVPVFDAVIPPGRHLGYVYEWCIMAVVTLLIMIVLQLRPPVNRSA